MRSRAAATWRSRRCRRDCFVAALLAMTPPPCVIASTAEGRAKQSRRIRRDCHGSLAKLGNLAMTSRAVCSASALARVPRHQFALEPRCSKAAEGSRPPRLGFALPRSNLECSCGHREAPNATSRSREPMSSRGPRAPRAEVGSHCHREEPRSGDVAISSRSRATNHEIQDRIASSLRSSQ